MLCSFSLSLAVAAHVTRYNMTSPSTEKSPLLLRDDDSSFTDGAPLQAQVLAELIGARHLPIHSKQPYCTVQYGSKQLHRTKPLVMNKASTTTSVQHPVWSIRESPLFLVTITSKDLVHRKNLVLTVWGGRPGRILSQQASPRTGLFLGKIRIPAPDILSQYCCSPPQRVELPLVDELGRAMPTKPLLALRFRLASPADVRFVHAWQQATELATPHVGIPLSVLFNGTGVLAQDHPRASLVTELAEWQVPGAKLTSAISEKVSSSVPRIRSSPSRNLLFRVKPCADPQGGGAAEYMNASDLHRTVLQPSRRWVQAGSGNLGRLYVEILSCHHLPNVDYGNAVGNVTDAFCAAIFGDAMAETDVIDDELSPHWPPWAQRAFCFSILHPSQVLYLAVFGYKRGALFHHAPIGRVEVNLTNFRAHNTVYNLHYNLSQSSHVTDRTTRGSIRIRLVLQWNHERTALLAALTTPLPPEVYVNVRRRKSLPVARYTCRGEYDNEEKFSLRVLLAYVDEIKSGFLRRILYAINDGGQSLLLWRGQVEVGGCRVWMPLHSLLLFGAALLVVEQPDKIPAVLFLGMAWFMLVQMQLRRQSPSPWLRCLSFGHYARILLLGSSGRQQETMTIRAGDGWPEQQKINQALEKRIREDDQFFQRKEAVEKEIEVVEQSGSVQTKSKAAVVPIELLVVLGKLQGIVGGFCRLLRCISAIVTWEESDLSFWVTFGFLGIGIIFLVVPWAFVLKWTCRCAVVLFLGPQNKLIDIYLVKTKQSDEKQLRKLLSERMFRARCRQEEAGKLKAFRHVLYGKYATAVPTSMWTPHQDHPLPESTAHAVSSSENDVLLGANNNCLYIPGQK